MALSKQFMPLRRHTDVTPFTVLEQRASILVSNPAVSLPLLHIAACNNDLLTAQMLLDLGADVNVYSCDGLTALHIAIDNKSIAMVDLLLKFNANVNLAKNASSPLYLAIEQGSVEIVKMLLDKGANVEDCNNNSLLHLAIEIGSYEIVKILVEYGANVNRHLNGITPLNLAVRLSDDRIISLLLYCGAEISVKSDLHEAIKLRSKVVVDLLLGSKPSLLNRQVNGKTALHLAVDYGYNHMVSVCLKHGASFDSLGLKMYRLFYDAVKSNDAEFVELLLKKGFPVNEFVFMNIRALDVAIRANFVNVTKILLKYGAYIHDDLSFREKTFALKYALLLLAEGHGILQKNSQIACSDRQLRIFSRKCRAELDRSRCEMIVSGVSFFDLLSGDEDLLAELAGNMEFIEAFSKSDYREKFEIYADSMFLNFTKGRLRNALLWKASWCYENEFKMPIGSAGDKFGWMTNSELMDYVREFCKRNGQRDDGCHEILIEF